MKKHKILFGLFVVILAGIFAMIPQSKITAEAASTVTVHTKYSNAISVSDNDFNVNTAFNNATTIYSQEIARASAILATAFARDKSANRNDMPSVLQSYGFNDCTIYSASSYPKEKYAVSYVTATQDILRNGHPAKLVLFCLSDYTANETSGTASVDIMCKETVSEDYTSNNVLTYYYEGKRLYDYLAHLIHTTYVENEDCVFWITGWGRGGSVGNCLAKRVVDNYGTYRVASYLFGVSNTARDAVTDNSSWYNSIFNINLTDDVATYLPLSQWGYGRWGVDVNLGLPTDSAARQSIKNYVNNYYVLYTANADRTKTTYLDTAYPFFSDGECNGVAIQNVLNTLYMKLGSSYLNGVTNYYTQDLSFRQYGSVAKMIVKNADKINMSVYDFLHKLLTFMNQEDYATQDVLDWFLFMKASTDESCDGNTFISFVMKYGFGIENLTSDFVSKLTSSWSFPLKELFVNHVPEAYLAWMELPGTVGILNYNDFPQFSSSCNESKTSNGCSIVSYGGLYSDQTFVATLNSAQNEYTFAFYYGTDTKDACRPYGRVAMVFSAPAGITAGATPYYIDKSENYRTLEYTYDETTKIYTLYNILYLNDIKVRFKTVVDTPVARTDAVYTGGNITNLITNKDGTIYSTYPTVIVNAGSFTVTCTLKNTDTYQWAAGYDSADLEVPITIAKRDLTVTANDITVTYNGKSQGTVNTAYTLDGLTSKDQVQSVSISGSATSAGTYKNKLVPSNLKIANTTTGKEMNFCYNISYQKGTLTILPVSVEIPTAVTGVCYDGEPHQMVDTLNDSVYETENYQAITPGSSIAVCTLHDTKNYKWSDDTTAVKYISWTLEKRPLTVIARDLETYETGEEIGSNRYDTVGSLASGHGLVSVSITGGATEAGVYPEAFVPFDALIKDGNGKNVNEYYEITYQKGKLTVHAVTELLLVQEATKKEYAEDERFDKTGMKISAKYDDETVLEIFTYTIDKTVLAPTDTYVTVSFLNKEVQQPVTVSAHVFDTVSYVWAEDFSTCTASVLCTAHVACGKTETVPSELTDSQAVSCLADGYEDYEATFTLAVFEKQTKHVVSEAQGHKPSDWIVGKDSSCDVGGYRYKQCTVCSEELEEEVILVKPHTYGNWKETKASTCVLDGEKEQVCSICKYVNKETLTKLGHDFSDDYTIDVKTHCTHVGSKSRHCSRCDAVTDVTEIPKTEHSWTSYITTKQATCEEDGEQIRTCMLCMAEDEPNILPALEHNYSLGFTVDEYPTCTVKGKKSRHCNNSGCTSVVDVTEIDYIKHEWTDWEKTVATCEEDGTETRYCLACGTEDVGKTTPSLGHSFSYRYTVDQEASCTEDGSKSKHCTRSGCTATTDTKIIPAVGHTEGEWATITKPTCVQKGLLCRYCVDCDELLDSKETPMTEHQKGQAVVTASTCVEVGKEEYFCTVCQTKLDEKELSLAEHAWEDVVTVEATHLSEGTCQKTCRVCGKTQEESNEKTSEHTFTDWTSNGESTHTGVCACGETETEEHAFGGDGVCERCGYVLREEPPAAEETAREKFLAEMEKFGAETLSGKADEATFTRLCELALLYNEIPSEEKSTVSAEFSTLTAALESYNEQADADNREWEDTNRNLFSAFAALSLPLLCVVFLLKKKLL